MSQLSIGKTSLRSDRFGRVLGSNDRNILWAPEILQTEANWCWAACALMIMAYNGDTSHSQCELATWLFKQTDCCSNPESPACDRPASDSNITSVYDQYGVKGTSTAGSVTFKVLQSQIDGKSPVEVGWNWKTGGGHVVLVTGCYAYTTDEYVYVNDHHLGQGMLTYSTLLNGRGQGSWVHTWTDLKPVLSMQSC